MHTVTHVIIVPTAGIVTEFQRFGGIKNLNSGKISIRF
jgi:hypothetical protein